LSCNSEKVHQQETGISCEESEEGFSFFSQKQLEIAFEKPLTLDILYWGIGEELHIGPKQILWLIERLCSVDEDTRTKAAVFLAESKHPAAAAALYLAVLSEISDSVQNAMLTSLGRMGKELGPEYLALYLEEFGPSLSSSSVKAFARSSGASRIHQSRWGDEPTDLLQALKWYDKEGKALQKKIAEDRIKKKKLQKIRTSPMGSRERGKRHILPSEKELEDVENKTEESGVKP
jgi:hypothetical protein